MRIRLAVWTLVALLAPLAYAQEDFIPPQPLADAGLVKYWQLQLILEKGQRLQNVFLVDDHLYLGTEDGYVFAVHAPTGLLRWLRPITRSGYPVRRPCRAGENVIFTTPSDMQIYDWATGDPVVRQDFRFPSATGPVSDGKLVFVGGLDHRLYAFDVETRYVKWEVITKGAIRSTPAIQGDVVFFANDSGTVYGCARADKTFRWQTSMYDQITADLVADERGVYVASRDYSLYLLDPGFGNVRWRARFSGPLYEPPVVATDLVYQYSPADGVVAVDAGGLSVTDDRFRWKLANGRTALTVHEGRTYLLTRDDTIVAVDTKDGQVKATVPACGLTLAMPAVSASSIFLAAPDGRLFCARPRGVPPLQREDLLAALQPPGAKAEAATSQPTTRPTARPGEALVTKQPGPPIGGKSKISREFKPGEKPE